MGPTAPGGQSGEAVIAMRLESKELIDYCWLIRFKSSSKLNALATGTSIFKACIKSPSSQNLNIDCTLNMWITFRRWHKLPEQQHEIHQHFEENLHTIRLPDCCCSRSFPNFWAVSHEEPHDNFITKLKHSSSEKHKEATQDYQGMLKHTGSATLSMSNESFRSWVLSIWNIATGVTAPSSVVLHESKSINGIKNIVASEEGHSSAS